jgi:hypothetical protein
VIANQHNNKEMSVITAVREYINKMLSEVLGMKALLMDEDTVPLLCIHLTQYSLQQEN